MRNKYVMGRGKNIKFAKEKLQVLVSNCMSLAEDTSDLAMENFENAWQFVFDSEDEDADYGYLCQLHEVLMKGMDAEMVNFLTESQAKELSDIVNKPAKANTEIAIDAMIYILGKHLFKDGNIRTAFLFANKIMIDNGCGIITIIKDKDEDFRRMLVEYYKGSDPEELKQWIYKYGIIGVKVEY